jgi:hypothetical protein
MKNKYWIWMIILPLLALTDFTLTISNINTLVDRDPEFKYADYEANQFAVSVWERYGLQWGGLIMILFSSTVLFLIGLWIYHKEKVRFMSYILVGMYWVIIYQHLYIYLLIN